MAISCATIRLNGDNKGSNPYGAYLSFLSLSMFDVKLVNIECRQVIKGARLATRAMSGAISERQMKKFRMKPSKTFFILGVTDSRRAPISFALSQ